jgi:sulfoxide reductase catalytic subunit YedY
MIIRTSSSGFLHPVPSDITSQAAYQSRRDLMRQFAAGTAGLTLAGWGLRDAQAQMARPGQLPPLASVPTKLAGAMVLDKATPYKDATTYNNFYEFGTDKSDPAKRAHTLKTDPWSVEIEGLVKKPDRLNLEDLLKLGAMEERIYRLRCVEGWSMVIPWVGYSLAELIRRGGQICGVRDAG